VFESSSVDGYFVDAQGDMSWAHAGQDDPAFADWVGGNASGGGALLFGRKTYEMMEAFWPTPAAANEMPIVAAGMTCRPWQERSDFRLNRARNAA
jgi:dihydrofolate reductase